MAIPSRQFKVQRITQSINTQMDFVAEPASTSAKSLGRLTTVFFDAPAALGWARTKVLSMMRCSISGFFMLMHSVPMHPFHTNGQGVCRCCSNYHIARAAVSRAHRLAPSTGWPPRSACNRPPLQRIGLNMCKGIQGFSAIDHRVVLLLTSIHYDSNFNTT